MTKEGKKELARAELRNRYLDYDQAHAECLHLACCYGSGTLAGLFHFFVKVRKLFFVHSKWIKNSFTNFSKESAKRQLQQFTSRIKPKLIPQHQRGILLKSL